MIPIQYAWILLFAISLTNAVLLNGICENDSQCTETGVVCTANKCQCNTPFYKPCNTSCELVPQFAYVEDPCAVTKNCVENAECVNNKCKCNSGYTLKNGACFKSLTATCQNHSECWSEYCLQSICACPSGYKPTDGVTTCKSALVDVYNTWAEANAANAFCEDDNSCFDIIAKCVNDTAHPQSKFCKCPSGYYIQDINNRRQCIASVSQNLSPLDSKPLNGYGECGKCADENAVCIDVAGQKTCWCRAGYVKRENKCVSRGKSEIIFPNSKDLQTHNFTASCSLDSNPPDQSKNQLCVCARGYKFVPQNRTCEKIVPKWVDEVYEYGLCTHINSKDEADADIGECPEPLKCLELNDKHVCSCEKDKFQDLDDSTQCVYFIGKGANATDRRCPQNTLTGTTDNCACADGYKVTPDNKQCELKLSPNTADTSCNASLTILGLCQNFGVNAVLCAIGECRCSINDSLPNKDLTRCYARLNALLPPRKEECPPNSIFNNNICTCVNGYRPSTDSRECLNAKVQLIEYRGPTISPNGGLTTTECKAWYSGSVEAYDNDNCQCTSIAVKADDISGCRYKPNVDLPPDGDFNFCSLNSDYIGRKCVCKNGYKEANNLCTPIVDQVYHYDDLTGVNVTGINDNICINLFGTASIKSPYGDYCVCKKISYPAPNKKICKFFINETSMDFKYPLVCPDNAIVFPEAQPSACICNFGYIASSDNQLCRPADIELVGAAKMDNTNNCTKFNNSDCIALFGEQAFCKNEACYCNLDLSFKDNDKCESFKNYKFPGEHELYLYACQEDGDCAGKRNVTCDYVDSSSKYKVCRCQDGAYLNPTTETCEDNRCTNCNPTLNFECRDYVCQCKSGYIRSGDGCIKYTTELQLYQPCNRTIFRDIFDDQALVCDANCNYARCKDGYRIENTKCVLPKLASDKCLQDETICKLIDQNVICSRDANQCLCGPSYYQWENKCARAVGSDCTDDDQCGIGICKAKRCDCKSGQRVENMDDSNGRPIQVCRNGIDQIRSNPVLLFLLLLVLARVVIN